MRLRVCHSRPLRGALQDKAGAQEALLEWIDAAVLPAEYGGSSTAGVGGVGVGCGGGMQRLTGLSLVAVMGEASTWCGALASPRGLLTCRAGLYDSTLEQQLWQHVQRTNAGTAGADAGGSKDIHAGVADAGAGGSEEGSGSG